MRLTTAFAGCGLAWCVCVTMVAGCAPTSTEQTPARQQSANGTETPRAVKPRLTEGQVLCAEFERAIAERRFGEMRKSLRLTLKNNPHSEAALMQLAFLAYAVDKDSLKPESKNESDQCLSRALKLDPQNEMAKRLQDHNEQCASQLEPPGGALYKSDKGVELWTQRELVSLEKLPDIRKDALRGTTDIDGFSKQ